MLYCVRVAAQHDPILWPLSTDVSDVIAKLPCAEDLLGRRYIPETGLDLGPFEVYVNRMFEIIV